MACMKVDGWTLIITFLFWSQLPKIKIDKQIPLLHYVFALIPAINNSFLMQIKDDKKLDEN